MKSAIVAGAMLVLLAPTSSTRADERSESQLESATDRLYAALLKGDATLVERLLADDFVAIHGNGSTATKAEYLASIRSGAFTYQRYVVHESRTRTYGDTAVIDALVTFSGNAGGKPFTGVDIRVTRIWVRQRGDWKCVGYQVTRVLPAKAGS